VASESSISGLCLLVSLASPPPPLFSCTIFCHQIVAFPNRTLSDCPARWPTRMSHRPVQAAPYSSCCSQAPRQLDSVWDSIASLERTRPYTDCFRTFLISIFTLDVRSPSMLSIFTIVALVLDVMHLTTIQLYFSYISDVDTYRLRRRAACRRQYHTRSSFHFSF
jgi:hypothetical protein